MSIYEIRRQNLIHLIGDVRRHGAVAEFARTHNLDPTYIRQIIGRNRTMGEKAARNFEGSIKIRAGSLDAERLAVLESPAAYTAVSEEAWEVASAFDQASPEMQAGLLRMLGILQQSEKK